MPNTKEFVLQKDLPDGAKAGDVYKFEPTINRYAHETKWSDESVNLQAVQTVENNPEWFLPKQLSPDNFFPPVRATDIDAKYWEGDLKNAFDAARLQNPTDEAGVSTYKYKSFTDYLNTLK